MVVVALLFCFCLGWGEREEREERDEAGFETGEDEPATGESREGTMPENLIEWRRQLMLNGRPYLRTVDLHQSRLSDASL